MSSKEQLGSRIDDAYVHAWDTDVYPLYHDWCASARRL